MILKTRFLFIIILIFLGLSSCNNYKKLMKSADYEKKYAQALVYYEKEDYARSQALFEEMRTVFRGTDKAENTWYYYAKSSFGIGEYTLAGYLFKEFNRQFPVSNKREECQYMAAYCYYLLSPELKLDQTDTKRAIEELQYFVENYPNSDKRQEAEKYIDHLTGKLEDKAFNNAMLYFTISDYKASVVALKNVLLDYPDSKHKEEIFFTILKSSYLLAGNSVAKKQKERYKNTIDAYFAFVDNFPESKKIKEAEKYYNNSLKFLETHNGQ